ncbi:MAG: ComEC/Rec2 family competence protein [Athalassotoga sp.]|uniref:ComEC/Rec2 family competence protein n=1 Tax=Athalassotoga sp. TaxID=2022597 RepID=UPI003D01C63A
MRSPFFIFFVFAVFGALLSAFTTWKIGMAILILAIFFVIVKRNLIIAFSLFFMGLAAILFPPFIPDGTFFVTGRINQVSGNAVSIGNVRLHTHKGWERASSTYVFIKSDSYPDPKISDLFMARIQKSDGKIVALEAFWTYLPESFVDDVMRWGANISDFIYMHFKEYVIAGSDTLASVFLGRRDVPYQLKQMYNESGYAQIFAVSGSNVWIIAALSLIFLSELVPMNYVKYPVVIMIIIFYGIITGLSIPTFRAILTFGIYTIFKITGRNQSMMNILGLVGLTEVLIDGSVIFDPSFQLSYSAVIGMITIMPMLPRYKPYYISDAFNAAIGANIGFTPFLILNFGKIYLASFPFNALVIPILMMIVMEGAVFLSFFAILGIKIGEIILGSGISPFVKMLDILAYLTTKMPLSTVSVPSKMIFFVITFLILSILVLIHFLRSQGIQGKSRKFSIDDL